MKNQLCPLCNSPATYVMVYEPEYKHFTCPVCTKFFIDEHSEDYLAGLALGVREERLKDLSERARRCSSDHRFTLRQPRPDEIHGDGHGVAKETMRAECVKQSQ